MNLQIRTISTALASAIASFAGAQVTSFSLERTNYVFLEPGPSGYFIDSTVDFRLETTNPGDFDSVDVVGPNPSSFPTLTKIGTSHRYFSSAGSYPEGLLENYPLGDYTFYGTGGTLGNLSATLSDVASEFTGSGGFQNYDEFTTRNEGQAVAIDIGGFTPRSGATRSYTQYRLNSGSGLLIEGVHEGTDPFSFGIAAGITQASDYYTISLEFHTEQTIMNAGFGGATGTISWVNAVGTGFNVQPVPEPATIAAVGLGLGVLVKRRRR